LFEGLLDSSLSYTVKHDAKKSSREISVRVITLKFGVEVDAPNTTKSFSDCGWIATGDNIPKPSVRGHLLCLS
jgi:hypothetical protein